MFPDLISFNSNFKIIFGLKGQVARFEQTTGSTGRDFVRYTRPVR